MAGHAFQAAVAVAAAAAVVVAFKIQLKCENARILFHFYLLSQSQRISIKSPHADGRKYVQANRRPFALIITCRSTPADRPLSSPSSFLSWSLTLRSHTHPHIYSFEYALTCL